MCAPRQLQQHVPEGWPLVVVVAGLPSIRDAERSVTYLERGEWHELGMLDREDTLLALRGPARTAGRPLEDDAAELLEEASGGYPYAVQVVGHHAWRASTGAKLITAEHVAMALPRADQDLAAGLYASRWEDASPKERQYLLAVAELVEDGADPTGRAVAARLGATTRELSYLRDRLLKKGTLVSTGGALRFPVPGMARGLAELHERVRARAAAEGRSMQAVVVEALSAAVPPLDAQGRLRARLAAEGMLYVPPEPAADVPAHAEVRSAWSGSGTAVSDAFDAERASR